MTSTTTPATFAKPGIRPTIALLVAALVACSPGPAPGADEFASVADARCAEAADALGQVAWPTGDQLTLASAAPALADAARIHRALVTDLRALAADGPGVAVVEAGERVADTFDRLAETAAAADQPAFDAALDDLVDANREASATSRRLGLEACYDAPPI